MSHIRIPKPWNRSSSEITPEGIFRNRRQVLRDLGFGGLGALATLRAGAQDEAKKPEEKIHPVVLETLRRGETQGGRYPAKKNPKYDDLALRPLSPEGLVGTYNNYYEFSTRKTRVWWMARNFPIDPWTVEIGGLVRKPMKIGIEDLLKKVTLDERIYRFRCVEAWAMTVPWTGFPVKQLIDLVEPTAEAKYVRFETFLDKKNAPGQDGQGYEFPYYEGLSMAEAMNELCIFGTGLYGHPLPKQNGAPLRLVVPWKYGFKSIKGIVKIEFVAKRPTTFWNELVPDEYSFQANVEPEVAHPRWSQAEERIIDDGHYEKTLLYNGYGKFVAGMYE